MKRIISYILLLAGIVIFLFSRFVLNPGTTTDWIMRVSGVLMIIGIFTASLFTVKEVKHS